MRVILDTCVLSELRKTDNKEHSCQKNVCRFIDSMDDKQLFLSVVTIGEISKGIHLLDKAIVKMSCSPGYKLLKTFISNQF